MSRDSWLNLFTAIVYGLVFILTVSITTTVVLWANGSFRLYTEPADKIKFNVSEVIISENAGEANICVVSGQAVVDESGKVISDPAFREDVKLELWHVNGINKVEESQKIVDIIVESDEEDTSNTGDEGTEGEGAEGSEGEENEEPTTPPTTSNQPIVVELGKTINLKALLDTDEYNKGGTCILRAYTMNELYKAEVKIYVDVPVQSIKINSNGLNFKEVGVSANNTEDEEEPQIEYNKFIQGDEFKLGLTVEPARALNSIKSIKTASFSVSESTDVVTLETFGDITDNTVSVNIIARNNYSGTFTLTAKLPKYYQPSYNEYDDSQFVFVTIQIPVEKLQLDEILIKSNITEAIEASLFTNKVTKVSARDTGDSEIINLDLFLKPAYYNPNTNKDPLEYMINHRYINLVITSKSDKVRVDPLTIEAKSSTENNQFNVIWEITANRIQLDGEDIKLQVVQNINQNEESEGDEEYITSDKTLDCEITYKEIEQSKLIHSDTYEFNITKKFKENLDSESIEEADNRLILSTANENGLVSIHSSVTDDAYSFTKLVFFVADNSNNENLVGSRIINTSESRQLIHEKNGKEDLDRIQPKGQGTVNIIPYLIMTDEEGNPLGYDFNKLEYLTDVAGIIYTSNLPNPDESLSNKYVVIKQYKEIRIKVNEQLVDNGLRFYNSIDSLDDIRGDTRIDNTKKYNIARGYDNQITLYVIGNSFLSMTEDKNMSLTTSGIEDDKIEYKAIDFGNNNTFNYAVVNLYVEEDSTAKEVKFTFKVKDANGEDDISLATMILNVVDVGVSKVKYASTSSQQGEEGGNPTSKEVTINTETNTLCLQPKVYTSTTSNNIYNLLFTDSNGKQQLPAPELVPQTINDIAIKDVDQEKYSPSLYKEDTKLTALSYNGTVKLFIANSNADLSTNLKVKGKSKNLAFYNDSDSLVTTITPADEYAEVDNNTVLMKKPIPNDKQLLAVYMLLEEFNNMQTNDEIDITPISMFFVSAQFPTITPSANVLAYFGPDELSTNTIKTITTSNINIDENNIEVVIEGGNVAFTSASEYVTVDASGIVKELKPNETSKSIYLLYLSTKTVEVGEGDNKTSLTTSYIFKVEKYTTELKDTSINKITIGSNGSYQIEAEFTKVLLANRELYSYNNEESTQITPAILNATVDLSDNTYFSISKENLNISLYSANNGGHELTQTEPSADQNKTDEYKKEPTKVLFTVTFQIVSNPDETDSSISYTADISYTIQLPNGYFLLEKSII